ncbi:MAG: putative ATP-dependent RNA helicase DHR1 [Stictis urceolatum]|nr:putative ATP-dependent RNA helicase DHR1 [Stictis urceolata]
MSSKKKKRLDKYIDNKLRKEESLELLKKLAAHKVDTSPYTSTKDLGVGAGSKRAALARALDRQRAGIATAADRTLLHDDLEEEDDTDESDESQVPYPKRFPLPASALALTPASQPEPKESSVTASPVKQSAGFGLKRPLETDAGGNPVIKKRQRTNKRSIAPQPEEIPWEGFSGSEAQSDKSSQTGTSNSSDGELSSDVDSKDDGASDSQGDDSDDLSDISESDYAAIFSTGFRPHSDSDAKEKQDQRRADFKAWANQQMNEARDFAPTVPMSHIEALSKISKPKDIKPRAPESDPLPRELQVPTNASTRQVFSVQVERSESMQESRLKLPIVAEEQKIMEAIHNNPVVVVCGATGSGKTTQVPQFLFEAGYGSPEGPTPGMIAVTQPRRVAAVTMAKRVGEELGGSASRVGYQIRFDTTVGKDTAIKFMTDGILIRELSQDFVLKKYSIIVIDEAHERSVNTDILLGMLSRIVDLRAELNREDPSIKPLKLVIMSATLMVDAFTKNTHLFRHGEPPLVESEGRQHPVTMHFARRTQRDYMEDAYKKITRGHRKLPSGGMLVFLTGQSEINALSKRLKQTLPTNQSSHSDSKIRMAARDAPQEDEDVEIGEDRFADDYMSDELGSEDDEDDDQEFEIGEEEQPASTKVLILPLYSQLPTKEQLKVFEPPPENTRLIILATNVAETSITIPGIRYVFDCGRVKEKSFDNITAVQSFNIGWISKASAAQRAGRAGRTGPGHCYRLYSSAVYERDFEDHTAPEVLKAPMESVVLQLKSMDLQHVINFPFPTPPGREDIAKAENLLAYLGGLDRDRKITSIGHELSHYPLSPRFAKMLTLGHQHDCMYLTIAMVAALSVSELFIPENALDLHHAFLAENEIYTNESRLADDARDARRKAYNTAHLSFSAQDDRSDAIKHLTAFCACAYAMQKQAEPLETFCSRMFLRTKAMSEAIQLFQQILYLVSINRPGLIDPKTRLIKPPSKTQLAALKQIVAVGFLDQIAIRADLAPIPPDMPRQPRRAIDVPYLTLFPSHTGPNSASTEESAVFISPSSILSHSSIASLPPYLVYSRLQRGTPSTIEGQKVPKTRMHPLTPVTAVQLSALAKDTPLLEYGKPIGKVEQLGEAGKRVTWVVPSLIGEKGRGGWPLPAVKVVQRKDGRGGWVVERRVG